jgi:hypothetical protein
MGWLIVRNWQKSAAAWVVLVAQEALRAQVDLVDPLDMEAVAVVPDHPNNVLKTSNDPTDILLAHPRIATCSDASS